MKDKFQYVNYCIEIIENEFIDKFKVEESQLPCEEDYLLNKSLIDKDNE